MRAARPCRVLHCRHLVRDGRPCPEHGVGGWRSGSASESACADPEYKRNRRRVMAEETACHWCGAAAQADDECDHLTPAAKGGGNERSNLARACRACNQRRGGDLGRETQRHRVSA